MEIKEKIEKAIVEENKKEKRERKYLYASDALQCQRKILLEFNGLPVEFDARTLRIFDNGHSVHDRFAKYLKQAGYEVEEEQNIPSNEHNIHRRFDAKIKEYGEPKIIEVKSINLRVVKEAKKEHVAQLHIYMRYTGIKKGYLVYESKQTQELFFFPIEFDEKVWEETEKWIKETNKMMEENKIPNIPFNFKKSTYPCSYCSFAMKCWGGEEFAK